MSACFIVQASSTRFSAVGLRAATATRWIGKSRWMRSSISQPYRRPSHAVWFSSTRPTAMASTTTSSSSSNYWNRETSKPKDYDATAPIIQKARIVSLTDPHDPANNPVNDAVNDPSILPAGASLVAVGGSIEDLNLSQLQKAAPNVLFVSHPLAREPLAQLLDTLPSIEWIHARSAGIDFITSPTLAASRDKGIVLTNAKGQFSSTLAEYTLMAIAYFAKNVPRLLHQKSNHDWNKYSVLEMRHATLGIIGYGDIGQACARLATVYGMDIVALKRRSILQGAAAGAHADPYCHTIYSSTDDPDALNKVFAVSDYILVATPLTEETRGMIGKEQFDCAKPNAVLINVGRGPVLDEQALVQALKEKKLKGAAMDVFETEPLPETSELWDMDNVLLSPHNMDQTDTFMLEASEFFVEENLPRFLRGIPLLNVIDQAAGY